MLGVPADVKAELKDAIGTCELSRKGRRALDFVLLFVRSQAKLKNEFSRVAQQLAPAGMLWVAWPKKTSGIPSDLSENEVRSIGLEIGLVDVKVCAVNEVWSGLKFVIRVKDRPKSR